MTRRILNLGGGNRIAVGDRFDRLGEGRRRRCRGIEAQGQNRRGGGAQASSESTDQHRFSINIRNGLPDGSDAIRIRLGHGDYL
jgi:hypothetical protein